MPMVSKSLTFVDTSAFYALLNQNDQHHSSAHSHWKNLAKDSQDIFTHNYIIVETVSLLQTRHGMRPVKKFCNELLAPVDVYWIKSDIHNLTLERHLERGKRSLSFVDSISLRVIDNLNVSRVFAFDDDFENGDYSLLGG